MMPGREWSDQSFPIHIRDRQNARSLPVKPSGESDDVGPLRVRAGQPDRRFDCLGSSAEKLRPAQLAGREIRDQPNECSAGLRSEAPNGDRLELFRERRDVARMSMAEARDRNTGVQIQIRSSIEIGERGSAPVVNRQLG